MRKHSTIFPAGQGVEPDATDPGAAEQFQREFGFQPEDFERVKILIHQHAGISLNDSKNSMVYSRLVRRIRATHKRNFREYLDQLENHAAPEWEHFINALTTNLTSFYRETYHFEVLTEYLQKLARANPRNDINIWCCAASSGEEPYTIAITAMEAFGSKTPPVHIVATDIDTSVLEIAKQGIYTEEQIRKVDAGIVERYFLPGPQPGSIAVRPEVKNLLTFRRVNLLDGIWPVRAGFDAIFCRNVLIYFDKPTQTGLLRRFAPLLHRDGLLFVGHSESFSKAEVPFTSLGKTVYEVLPEAACPAYGARPPRLDASDDSDKTRK